MKKLTSRWSNICSKPINFRIKLLCEIFVIWLILQFFLQTFITFKLGRDWKFWTLFRMWKEFIIILFVIILLRYIFANLKWRIKSIKNKENTDKITRKLLLKNIESKFIIQFILIFIITSMLSTCLNQSIHIKFKIWFIMILYILNMNMSCFIIFYRKR